MLVVDGCWKKVLLNQFHDVLPGTCIEQVTHDAWEIYEQVFSTLMAIRNSYHALLLGPSSGTTKVVFNPLPWEVTTVIFNKPESSPSPLPPTEENVQLVTLSSEEFEDQIEGRYRVPNTFSAALVTLRASGYTQFIPQEPTNQVSYIGKFIKLY
jgi:alpha-mannosidase